MAVDLSFPVEVVGCPIVREADGLALSSRNVYLTPPSGRPRRCCTGPCRPGADAVASGRARPGAAVVDLVAGLIAAEPLAELDYAEVVDAVTLAPTRPAGGEVRLLVAARFGRPRLLDNLRCSLPSRTEPQSGHGDPPGAKSNEERPCAAA